MRLTVGFCLAFIAAGCAADDWPQWRGEHRDSVLGPNEQVDSIPNGVAKRKWTVEVGGGYSGPTVAGGRVYMMDRGPAGVSEQIERVLCFDAADGSEVWTYEYPAKYSIRYTAGPRTSVTIDGGRALAVGAMGHFHCLDAESGKLIWERDLLADYDIKMPIWGITASPLVYRDLVIQIAGGKSDACVIGLDLKTGNERWRALDERAGYSSPVLIKQGDQDVVVCWTGESVAGLNPENGELFWRIDMSPRNMPIGVPTPVIDDNQIFVSSFYDGSLLIEFDKDKPQARELWRRVGVDEKNTDALHCMISNPVIRGDYIYGVDSYGELRCLDKQTGDRVWEDDTAVKRNRWATIQIIKNGDREIMFNEQGQVILASLSPKGYVEHARAALIAPTRQQLNRRGGVTWAHPAIANGYIFARSDKELVCAPLASADSQQ